MTEKKTAKNKVKKKAPAGAKEKSAPTGTEQAPVPARAESLPARTADPEPGLANFGSQPSAVAEALATAEPAAKNRPPRLADRPEGGWRRFFVYGIVWGAIFLAIGGGVKGCLWVRGQIALIHSILHPDEWDGAWTDGKIRNWIKKNLPHAGAQQRGEVADALRNVAGMLRAEEITTGREAFAELIAQTQPAAPRAVWGPFLTRLGKMIQNETEGGDAGEIADLFDEAADALDAKRTANTGAGPPAAAAALASAAAPKDTVPNDAGEPDEASGAGGEKSGAEAEKNDAGGDKNDAGNAKSGAGVKKNDAEAAKNDAGVKPGVSSEPSKRGAGNAGNCPGGSCPAAATQNGGYYQGGWLWY